MKKPYLILIVVVGVGLLAWWASAYLKVGQKTLELGQIINLSTAPSTPTSVDYIIEEVASGLSVPWSMVFTSPTRMLVTERPGRLRVIEDGVLKKEPLHTFAEVSTGGEQGLMGLTLDPDYPDNKFIYLSLAYNSGRTIYDKVVRWKDEGAKLTEEKIIIDKIPAASNHAGSRLKFGPDNKLYITTGDATDRPLAQDKNSLAGKILRLNNDGTIPADNPFANSPLWSYGHRNPQGIAWQAATGEMYATEHGPSVFDGPAGGDEINHIMPGANYGWPLVSHKEKKEGTIAPIALFTPAEAPSGLLIYSGTALPQFKNNLFFGALRGQGIVRLVLDSQDANKIITIEKLKDVKLGRIREVIEGPDGNIYFSTSNRDGRGTPAAADDRIFRIRPKP